MTTIHELVNIGSCSQNGMNGTNNNFCILDVSRIKKILRFPYNYKFASNFEPTEVNFTALEQAGILTPLYTIVDAEFTTEANGVQTFGGGVKKVIEKMPFQIDGKMLNGTQGYINTISVSNANAHSFLLVDVNDTIFGFKGKDGLFRPINSEFFNVEAYKGAGAESANYMIQLQLDRTQIDSGLSGLKSEEYNFEIDDVTGYTNLDIIVPAVPVVGGTGFNIQVLRKEDRVAQLGLTTSEIKVYVAGVVATPTIGTPTTAGVYAISGLTAFTLGQTITIKTNDGTYDIVDLDGKLLKAKVVETIVVA